jgi:SAM-dependent methyltransferase
LVVWHAAEAFGELLAGDLASEIVNRSVLELGSGTGLCGLLCSKISGRLTVLTDGAEDSLDAMEDSIALNGAQDLVKAHRLNWGSAEDAREILDRCGGPFDMVIATDVIYEREAVGPLLQSASAVLRRSKHGKFLLANHKFRFVGLRAEIERCLREDQGMRLVLLQVSRIGNDDIDYFEFGSQVAQGGAGEKSGAVVSTKKWISSPSVLFGVAVVAACGAIVISIALRRRFSS